MKLLKKYLLAGGLARVTVRDEIVENYLLAGAVLCRKVAMTVRDEIVEKYLLAGAVLYRKLLYDGS